MGTETDINSLLQQVERWRSDFTLKYSFQADRWLAFFGDDEEAYKSAYIDAQRVIADALKVREQRETPNRFVATVPVGCAEMWFGNTVIQPGQTATVERPHTLGSDWIVTIHGPVAA